MMDQMHIHRLIVGGPEDVRGIVTQTDIIAAVRRKLKKAREARLQQQSELGQLAKSAMTDLSSIHCLLQEIHCFQESVTEAVKMVEPPVNAPCLHSAIPQRDQNETAGHDNILKKLETHLSNAQDTLTRLAKMSKVPTSAKSVPS
jgi:signal-transduction protein with cAMP-binding, CBS, and nucleotidyltransferase domain